MIHYQKTGLDCPYSDALHLLDHQDHLATVLACGDILRCECADIEARRQEVAVGIGDYVDGGDKRGVCANDEDDDPIVQLQLPDGPEVESPRDESAYDDKDDYRVEQPGLDGKVQHLDRRVASALHARASRAKRGGIGVTARALPSVPCCCRPAANSTNSRRRSIVWQSGDAGRGRATCLIHKARGLLFPRASAHGRKPPSAASPLCSLRPGRPLRPLAGLGLADLPALVTIVTLWGRSGGKGRPAQNLAVGTPRHAGQVRHASEGFPSASFDGRPVRPSYSPRSQIHRLQKQDAPNAYLRHAGRRKHFCCIREAQCICGLGWRAGGDTRVERDPSLLVLSEEIGYGWAVRHEELWRARHRRPSQRPRFRRAAMLTGAGSMTPTTWTARCRWLQCLRPTWLRYSREWALCHHQTSFREATWWT